MKQRIRFPDGRNLDRDLGPGGERRGHAQVNVGGEPISAAQGKPTDTGYSQTKPGVRIPWR